MTKLLPTLFALAVASATGTVLAQDKPGNAQAGEKKIAMCIGCHGIVGYQASFPEVYKVPKISGQSGAFISAALNAYKKGERRHPSMRGIADSLSDQDIADIAAFYEKHGGGAKAAGTASREPSPEVAALINRDKDNSCTACHGANFSTPKDGSIPKIGGQHADYLFVALKAYKTDGHGTWGRGNGVMGGVAKKYTNAELKALAGYISTLDGELATVPQSKFR